MYSKWTRILNRFTLKNRMLIFLLGTLILIISFPLVNNTYSRYLIFVELLFNFLMIFGIHLVSKNKQIVAASLLIALMAITVIAFDVILQSRPLLLFGLVLEVIFTVIAVVMIIRHVLQYKKVTEDKIYGAISAYLLIGISWALIYSILELFNPHSFFFDHGFVINQDQLSAHRFYFSQFIYLSFVTLSTLGYGDIVPITGLARLFASLESVAGQLYVAVLIARLVGLHISHAHIKRVD